MARSAAAQLLACSARPFLPGHHHHHARRPLLLLNSRSKTSSSSNFPRPSSPRDPGSSLFYEISDLVASARNGSALRPEMNDEACHHDRGAAAVQRAEGARGIAPESATAASSSVFCSISNMGHLGGLPDDGSQPSDTAGNAVNPDADNVSEAVHRIMGVLWSQAPVSSMEERLESLGVTYTPQLVNMVLKRCFKVRQLGFWFFHWVKRLPGFRHTRDIQHDAVHHG